MQVIKKEKSHSTLSHVSSFFFSPYRTLARYLWHYTISFSLPSPSSPEKIYIHRDNERKPWHCAVSLLSFSYFFPSYRTLARSLLTLWPFSLPPSRNQWENGDDEGTYKQKFPSHFFSFSSLACLPFMSSTLPYNLSPSPFLTRYRRENIHNKVKK